MLPASRVCLRSTARPSVFAPARKIAGQRFISTNPPHLKSRSWKSSALRWGLAAAGVYYYNTSPVFADSPDNNLLNPNVDALSDEYESSMLDTLTESSRRKSQKNASVLQSAVEKTSADHALNAQSQPLADIPAVDASPAELEEEAEGQGAFNPETGEINWDCPCLGGMAHGPCGEEFKAAFSCFVYSTEEPKGMDCIDKFQNMQNCFRAHPDHYKAELEDDEELDAELAEEKEQLTQQIAERKAADDQKKESPQEDSSAAAEPTKKISAKSKPAKSSSSKLSSDSQPQPSAKASTSSEPHPGMSEEHEVVYEGQSSPVQRKSKQPRIDPSSSTEDDTLLPRAAHDARGGPQTSK